MNEMDICFVIILCGVLLCVAVFVYIEYLRYRLKIELIRSMFCMIRIILKDPDKDFTKKEWKSYNIVVRWLYKQGILKKNLEEPLKE